MTDFNRINWPKVIFVTGIGTDVGKTYATGWLAREMNRQGLRTITQKMVQTGNVGRSEDIEKHRMIMGIDEMPEDKDMLTAPEIFTYPCSPDLAARIDNRKINLPKISDATNALLKIYPHVLLEGAGGLMVPLDGDYLTADYLTDMQYPTLVTVTGQLGSINHALLTLNAIKNYGINLFGIIYNPYFDKDSTICADTKEYLQRWMEQNFKNFHWIEMPDVI